MIEIPVIYISYKENIPPDSYADHTMLHDIFSGDMWSWKNQYKFTKKESFEGIENGAVVVVPARFQDEYVSNLNNDIAKLNWVIIILTGDEESVFSVEKISHPNMKIWVMSPKPGRHDIYRKIGSGYTNDTRRELAKYTGEKSLNWFFSGQINNQRRRSCVDNLGNIQDRLPGELIETPGFYQGLIPSEYYEKLSKTKIAPSPSGSFTPDCFRLFEALEAGCIPIADNLVDGIDTGEDYWKWLFGSNTPFPGVNNWDSIFGYMSEYLVNFQEKSNQIYAWWQSYKRQLCYWMREDIKTLSGIDFEDPITVLIPTSPIKSHPDTRIIEKTITDVRTKLPEAEIIIMIDGVNPKQEHLKESYTEYTKRLLWKCNFEWHNVLPIVFTEWNHQVSMTRKALEMVTTPMILFVEHDTPICPDPEFTYPWEELIKPILSGEVNVIRFHHEALILDSSKPLLMGEVENINGVPMVKTMQWSQRPHLASTIFYKKMINHYFSPDTIGMIEDHIYGEVFEDCKNNGIMGWYNWRLWIYHPEGENIKRSYHIDGREGEPKYEELFKY